MTIIYYALLAVSIIITIFAIANLISSRKIEKNIDNYIYIATTKGGYFIGAVLFSLALFVVMAFQAMPYVFNFKIFSILLFFFSIFLLSLSHLVYYLVSKKKLSDYKEFFKKFEVDLKNNCHLLMLKHIISKEKDEKKIKEIFLMNKHLCDKN